MGLGDAGVENDAVFGAKRWRLAQPASQPLRDRNGM